MSHRAGIKSIARGFTLIELLVVIAIIGVLSSIVLASLNTARTKANDTKRKADLNEVAKALTAYYLDNGFLPGQADGWCAPFRSPPGSDIWTLTGTNMPAPFLAPNYISQIPIDPRGYSDANTNYMFFINSTRGGSFTLGANMEGAGNGHTCSCGGPSFNYCITVY